MRIVALLYALSWVAVRGMLVCGCPASKGGILRAISPAGRRFRASALVSGREHHDVYKIVCIHVHLFLVFAFRDARFLSGLYGRFSYIVRKSPGENRAASWQNARAGWGFRVGCTLGTGPDRPSTRRTAEGRGIESWDLCSPAPRSRVMAPRESCPG